MTDPTPQSINPSIPETLPPMSRQEATFHASVAGVRASAEASKQGNDPAHSAAIGTAAVGGKVIGGLTLPLPCAYSALAVPALGALLEQHSRQITGLQSDCLFILAFAAPEEVYRLACVQRDESACEALIARADQVAITLLHRDTIDEASAWCMEAFARLNGVKKPQSPEATPPPQPLNPSTHQPLSPPASESGSETRSSAASPPAPTTAAVPAGSPV